MIQFWFEKMLRFFFTKQWFPWLRCWVTWSQAGGDSSAVQSELYEVESKLGWLEWLGTAPAEADMG